MAGFTEGFESYWVSSSDELDRALDSALVVVDTNVLLDLYRVVDRTRDDLFHVLERLGDRLWVPHQVAAEFWRNRVSVLRHGQDALAEVRKDLDRAYQTAAQAVRRWERSATGDERAVPRLQRLAESLDAIYADMEGMAARSITSDATAEDPVVARLVPLLDGRVGDAPSPAEWQERVAEGRRRVEAGLPPGYLDAGKEDSGRDEGAAGDYLVWRELMDESRRRGGEVLFVTGDRKADWWWQRGAVTLGPRTELSRELRESAGTTLRMVDLRGLLARSAVLDVAVSVESIEDAGRLRAPTTWSADGVHELLRRLDAEGQVQATVVRAAARAGGWIPRDEIHRLCGFDSERTLRRFAAPVWRITADLQAEGRVANGVPAALEASYVGVRADGYAVPEEIVALLSEGD